MAWRPAPIEDGQVIYTVECSFADPDSEAEWNDFYSLRKLPALISVGGFHTSQRFKALSGGCPVYLALHTVDGLDVLIGEEYRLKGGGNFARWQRHITDWHRNLYDGIARAPAVGQGELLVMTAADPQPLTKLGLAPSHLQAMALEKSPARRWLAKAERAQLPDIGDLPPGLHAYEAMTPQLTSDGTVAAAR